MKQLGTGIVMYSSDYDEMFPIGFEQDANNWSWTNSAWPILIQPYIKNLNVFTCPSDVKGGVPSPPTGSSVGWAGITISYAANGSTGGWSNDVGSFPLLGVMGVSGNGQTWLNQGTGASTLAKVARPAETILIAEKHSGDSVWDGGVTLNSSGYGPDSVFMGPTVIWGDGNLPNGAQTPANAPYPTGANGAVSAHHNGFANFAFCDGHVKAMTPIQTDPDMNGQPQNNMWDATRK